ncbi:IS66 family insertion sequence element accessory protein TnpA [Sorangium atrum]|uniref:IS66 family insertion sequence element accessory protein TnpA n=1 Tax=Sorangium atrum TaxID=2995308 RepID=UPI004032C972
MATKAEWAERVGRWERSGQSAEKFARHEGYKPKQLYSRRWKLRSDGAPPPSSTEAPHFLPVHVVTDASPVAPEPVAHEPSARGARKNAASMSMRA